MRFMEIMSSCPPKAESSRDHKREWFLLKLINCKSREVHAYLGRIPPASIPQEQPGCGAFLSKEQWRGVMLTVKPEADAEDIRQTLVALGFLECSPIMQRRVEGGMT